MREACLQAASAALGREVTQAEARGIERRIETHMRLLARQDPQAWAAMPQAQRLTEAGKAAAKGIVAEARLLKERLETRVLRLQALEAFVNDQVSNGADRLRVDAVHRALAPFADAKGAPQGGSVDEIAQGAYADAVRSLMDVFEAGKRRGVWRFIPFNEPGTNNLLRAALNKQPAPPEFQAMAKLAEDYIDLMRRRYNAAGGQIGKLEDWGEPHRWSEARLARAINKNGRSAVIDDFVRAANGKRYVNEDGTLYTPQQLRDFFDNAITTILTDGANKRVSGDRPAFAQSVLANRHRAHREIHLRQDAVGAMLDKYSELGALESLLLHMRTLARDVALVETFGANAELTARHLIDQAADQDRLQFQGDRSMMKTIQRQQDHAHFLFDHLAGMAQGRDNLLSKGGQFLRSWATFTSLGSTVLSSVTDPMIMQHVASARGLDQAKLFINDVAQFAGVGRRWAKRAGLITDTVAGYADRLSFDHLSAPDLGARAASFTLKASGLNWVTEARRAAYGMTMMDAIGHLVRHFPTIETMKNAEDRRLLGLLNVDQAIWDIWRLAKLETRGANHTLLTPAAIYAIDDASIEALAGMTPPVRRGFRRWYHGGDPQGVTGSLWFTSSLQDAQGWASRSPGMSVWYVDVPEAELQSRFPDAAGDLPNGIVPLGRFEFPADVATRRQIYNAQGATSGIEPNILKNRAVSRLLGIVKDETNTAVITAGSRERSAMLGDQTKSGSGTIGGELRRAVVLFRSYPWTFLTRQLRLAQSMDNGVNRGRYAASLFISLMVAGYISNWLYDLIAGRNPRNINPSTPEGRRAFGEALVRGGGLPFLADFLYANSDPANRSQSLTAGLTGPVLSDIDAIQQLTLGNLNQAAAGQETNAGPEAVRFAQSNLVPNFWYTRAAVDRYIFQALQEEIEPGYNARMAQRQYTTRGTTYWWQPATPIEDAETPDFSQAVEGE